MRLVSALILVGSAGLFSCAAYADDFTPITNLGSTVLDLDTAGGKYSAWVINDLGTINAVRATIQVHRLGTDPKWEPDFSITLSNAKESATLQIAADTAPSPPLRIRLMDRVDDAVVEDHSFATAVGLDQKLDVSVGWTAAGEVTVWLGSGESEKVVLHGTPMVLKFTGSTGEVEFNPLQLGHAGP